MKRFSLAVCLLPLLAACGGGGASVSGAAARSSLTVPLEPQSISEAQNDAKSRPLATPVPASSDLLYIGNLGNNSITIYHHDAQGNASPIGVISGSKTEISEPGQLSEDAAGDLYVANNVSFPHASYSPSPLGPSILVFAHGANGNVAPLRTIVGAATTFKYDLGGMTVDQVTGKIFAVDTDIPFDGGQANLLRFPPNASGNEAPFAVGGINLFALELASDSSGKNIIEAHIDGDGCCSNELGVDTYVKQFANNTAPNEVDSVQGMSVTGVADDPSTKTYLVSTTSGIIRLAENTNGIAAYDGNPSTLQPAIISTITSATNCGQLALGYLRNIYSVCGDEVNVYTHDSSGNVSPLRVLSGSATKLNMPYGIYEGK